MQLAPGSHLDPVLPVEGAVEEEGAVDEGEVRAGLDGEVAIEHDGAVLHHGGVGNDPIPGFRRSILRSVPCNRFRITEWDPHQDNGGEKRDPFSLEFIEYDDTTSPIFYGKICRVCHCDIFIIFTKSSHYWAHGKLIDLKETFK